MTASAVEREALLVVARLRLQLLELSCVAAGHAQTIVRRSTKQATLPPGNLTRLVSQQTKASLTR